MSLLDELRKDLQYQLSTLDELDWNYFVETALRAKDQADIENRNFAQNKMENNNTCEQFSKD